MTNCQTKYNEASAEKFNKEVGKIFKSLEKKKNALPKVKDSEKYNFHFKTMEKHLNHTTNYLENKFDLSE